MKRFAFPSLAPRTRAISALMMIAFGSVSRAENPAPPIDRMMRAEKPGTFTFSLLPKSFQKNPMLDMTANTEVTAYGKLLRPASPEAPVYYVAQAGGFKQMGSLVGGERPPGQQDMEAAMKNALAVNGYRPADPAAGHYPSLAVMYSWGSHNRLDSQTARDFPQLAAQYKLERAILVGGKKYLADRSFAMEWGDISYQTTEKEYLDYQAADSLYFVVASAYDYASLAKGERKLAWRTTMTVNAVGVSVKETLPPLIANAAVNFGRETPGPQVIQRRMREGRVDFGKPTIVEPSESMPSAAKP